MALGDSGWHERAVAGEEEMPGTPGQRRSAGRLAPLFGGAILLAHVTVGLLLLALAVAALGYAVYTVPQNLRQGAPRAIAALFGEVLLALILVEVIRTVLAAISTRSLSLRPFLTVVVLASVRRILAISAELSLAEDLPEQEFTRAIAELLLDGAIILVAAIAAYLLSRRSAA